MILLRYPIMPLLLEAVRALSISLPSCLTGKNASYNIQRKRYACSVVLSFELWLMNRDSKEQRDIYGIKDNLIRFSIGVEDFEDLKNDLVQALEKV